MKTDDLITLIAQDTRRPANLKMALGGAVLAGAVLPAIVFFAGIGVRPDVVAALETVRFPFKFVVTLTLLATAAALLKAMISPGSHPRVRRWLLLAAPLLLFLAVVIELIVTPSQAWLPTMVGTNAVHCLTIIPILSLFPAIALLAVMRQGAPEHPGRAGALAGLVSAGIAATLYASNCFDDSPLFVAAWYVPATLLVVFCGYLAGRVLLRW